ncbi:SWIM zinc finger family protein [Corynebacterium sp. TAE3-ERU12]|uniref:SWIM zinc finger family protein n=1 Tax=Corynebacterium sp. TAE3-ERU12 TaxID=2849491 RepID=UPI001C486303|nr:SWIM zinc finger family protein [Corynebacterium sp. TAE3-ERU12]MBV7295087.1 SWIM zinc finger family protein [Corynebacterium sp. TAE3-ERU12]
MNNNVYWVDFSRNSAQQPLNKADDEHRHNVTYIAPPAQLKELATFNWAGKAIVNVAAAATDKGRCERGAMYWREERVTHLTFRAGVIAAEVRGSQLDPFEVTLTLPHRDATEVYHRVHAMADRVGGVGALLSGSIDSGQARYLVAGVEEPLRTGCTCPDRQVVCKHVMAVALAAGELMTKDPRTVLELRGVDTSSIPDPVGKDSRPQQPSPPSANDGVLRWGSGAEVPVASAPEKGVDYRQPQYCFWGEEVFLEPPSVRPAPASYDMDSKLLHKAMAAICFNAQDSIQAVSDIEDLYITLVKLAERDN